MKKNSNTSSLKTELVGIKLYKIVLLLTLAKGVTITSEVLEEVDRQLNENNYTLNVALKNI